MLWERFTLTASKSESLLQNGMRTGILGKILNGKREPKNAEAKVKEALEELLNERKGE